jgi:glycosyltransferase involved in cell wall biosynthesis
MCDEWAKKDNRIKVIHKENGGLSDARNAGLEIASGEYIAFVDSDDYIHPQMYELMLDAMCRTQCNMVSCRLQQVDANKTVEYPVFLEPTIVDTVDSKTALGQFYEKYFDLIWVSACVKLYHRSIFETLRFCKGIVFEDLDVFPYVVAKAQRITVMENVFYYCTVSPNSITRSGFSEKYIDTIEMQGRHIDFFLQNGYLRQAQHAAAQYIRSVILTYQAINEKAGEIKPLFWREIRKTLKTRRKQICENCKPGRMQKMILAIFPWFPQLAVRIYRYITG